MSKRSDLRKKQKEFERKAALVLNILFIIFCIAIAIGTVYFTVKIYNPKRQQLVKNSNYVFRNVQKEISEIYKKQGFLFETTDSVNDEFCAILGKKFAEKSFDCNNTDGNFKKNFTFKKTTAEIYGLEKPAQRSSGSYIKYFFIDVNGEKGENAIGIDRIPLKMYSTGRMGGLLVPVNCSRQESLDFGFDYPAICSGANEINFMATNIPFGFDVWQIGGDGGKTRSLNRDIPFLRADCIAFGGEMEALDDYCSQKGYPWLEACYDEFPCAVELSERKL